MDRTESEDGVAVICRLVKEVHDLGDAKADDDIYDLGFPSIEALNLLIRVEEHFGVTIEDDSAFAGARTPRGLWAVVARYLNADGCDSPEKIQ
jgi:acyl carrier protein